jgi:hypothetical protein
MKEKELLLRREEGHNENRLGQSKSKPQLLRKKQKHKTHSLYNRFMS